ncbi:MAG: hypothetical protein M1824_006189 [Vezdaea acicularis]|nr:MAG: hypothetical protein M1824_006189 [Vezdaea acicularis]
MVHPKRVAIIGAGPGGLVAAKTLLLSQPVGHLIPTIFERNAGVGGLWHNTNGQGTRLSPSMRTNLSKFTVCFSDLAWDSAKAIPSDIPDKPDQCHSVPLFPTAWQVEEYLQRYASKYIPEGSIRFNCTVTNVALEEDGQWRLTWTNSTDNIVHRTVKDHFDYLVVSSGYFAAPYIPQVSGLSDFKGQVLHSSDLFKDRPQSEHASGSGPHKVAVIGGAMSGAEAAASLAMQLSSSRYSPGTIATSREVQIHHVVSRPFWCMPHLVPEAPDQAKTTFTPLDLCMYDLSRRPSDQITLQTGPVPMERAVMVNEFLERLLGGDQNDLGNGQLTMSSSEKSNAPRIAISETYREFVRSKELFPVIGRLESIKAVPEGKGILIISNGETITQIQDISQIIFATGFHPSLSYLDASILDTLNYDPTSHSVPLLLNTSSTNHPAFPNLGFVGFYQGPFFGVMEMQARLLAQQWADPGHIPPIHVDETYDSLKALRQSVNNPERVPQYPMGDYVGLMERFAQILAIPRSNLNDFPSRSGPVTPCRYADKSADFAQSQLALASLTKFLAKTRSSSHVAKASFRALQGTWKLDRILSSAMPTFPSGTFSGTASFKPRYPTGEEYDSEYLYVEDGEFMTEDGISMQGNRRYVYRYREDLDVISAWFVKSDDGKTVDYHFHDLKFVEDSPTSIAKGSKAQGYHLCEQDQYSPEYSFHFQGVSLKKFDVKYTVRGPKKDYYTDTCYQRW